MSHPFKQQYFIDLTVNGRQDFVDGLPPDMQLSYYEGWNSQDAADSAGDQLDELMKLMQRIRTGE